MMCEQVEDVPIVGAQVFFFSFMCFSTSLVRRCPKGFVFKKPSRWVAGNKLVRQMANYAQTSGVKKVLELAGKLVLLPGCVSTLYSTIESPSACGAWQGGLQSVEAMMAILTRSLRQLVVLMYHQIKYFKIRNPTCGRGCDTAGCSTAIVSPT